MMIHYDYAQQTYHPTVIEAEHLFLPFLVPCKALYNSTFLTPSASSCIAGLATASSGLLKRPPDMHIVIDQAW